MIKSICIAFFAALLFSNNSIAQKFDLGEYQMEVIEVLQKNAVGGVFLTKKEKFVGIKVLLTPKSKKNKGLDLSELVLKSGGEEYEVKLRRPFGISSTPRTYIKMRKPKEEPLYAIVNKSFKKGAFYYKGNKLFDIEVKNGSEIGTFKL